MDSRDTQCNVTIWAFTRASAGCSITSFTYLLPIFNCRVLISEYFRRSSGTNSSHCPHRRAKLRQPITCFVATSAAFLAQHITINSTHINPHKSIANHFYFILASSCLLSALALLFLDIFNKPFRNPNPLYPHT